METTEIGMQVTLCLAVTLLLGFTSIEAASIPDDVRGFLESGGGIQVHRVIAAVPEPVRLALAKAAHEEPFSMADPGAAWQVGCIVESPPKPRRRLHMVACSAELCMVSYELGGIVHSHHVVFVRRSAPEAVLVWRAVTTEAIQTPKALLGGLRRGSVNDDPAYGF